MPASYAHDRFGRDVLRALPGRHAEAAGADMDLFSFGLQGPDILYYYKPLSHHVLHRAGNALHERAGLDLFPAYARIFDERGKRRSDYSYLCGMLCHFALDRACHGTVIACAAQGAVSHEEVESEFDRILLEEDGLDPVRTVRTRNLHPSRRAASVIAPYYEGVSTGKILRCLRSFSLYGKLLTVPGRAGYRRVDALLQHLPQYPFIHGHLINLDPDPDCEEAVRRMRAQYDAAVSEAVSLILSFVPAAEGRRKWPDTAAYNFLSERRYEK
ncbi:MAG: zinc dependent phospholipase C family protein [Lachnospiraceae bacterium]|nr:zinc dependent phospholipase C family protein [Lachnospiraceae bacterium]